MWDFKSEKLTKLSRLSGDITSLFRSTFSPARLLSCLSSGLRDRCGLQSSISGYPFLSALFFFSHTDLSSQALLCAFSLQHSAQTLVWSVLKGLKCRKSRGLPKGPKPKPTKPMVDANNNSTESHSKVSVERRVRGFNLPPTQSENSPVGGNWSLTLGHWEKSDASNRHSIPIYPVFAFSPFVNFWLNNECLILDCSCVCVNTLSFLLRLCSFLISGFQILRHKGRLQNLPPHPRPTCFAYL